MSVRLITRGDDVGSLRSANRATLDAHQNGILKNASLMAVCPYIEEAAELLVDKTDLCFGLHLTMNSEWESIKWGPVLGAKKVPSLVDADGHFFPTPNEHHASGIAFSEMLAECKAQLQKVRELGFTIDYMETHMGFDWLFEGDDDSHRFHDELKTWAEQEDIIFELPFLKGRPKSEAPDGDRIQGLVNSLSMAEDGTYLLVGHPCFDDEETRGHTLRGAKGDQAQTRDEQRRYFTDKRMLDLVAAGTVEPIKFSEAP